MFAPEYCLTHAIIHHPPKTDPSCSAVSLRQLSYLLLVAVEDASVEKAASQSATVPGRLADYAVDGNINTTDLTSCASAFYDDQFTQPRAWWQVNLGDLYLVKSITVHFPTFYPG